jgi:hypothetical protein
VPCEAEGQVSRSALGRGGEGERERDSHSFARVIVEAGSNGIISASLLVPQPARGLSSFGTAPAGYSTDTARPLPWNSEKRISRECAERNQVYVTCEWAAAREFRRTWSISMFVARAKRTAAFLCFSAGPYEVQLVLVVQCNCSHLVLLGRVECDVEGLGKAKPLGEDRGDEFRLSSVDEARNFGTYSLGSA